MQRLTQFTKKVNKIISEEIKEKEKQNLMDLETEKGINNLNLQEADQYLSEKFMRFFTAKMISYFKYYKEQGVEKNEKDFQNSMKNQLISVYQHNGKVIFSTMTFKSIAEQLKLKQQTIQEQNDYIKKNLNKIDMKKTIDIKEDTYKLVLFDKLKKYQDFNKIAEQLQLVIY